MWAKDKTISSSQPTHAYAYKRREYIVKSTKIDRKYKHSINPSSKLWEFYSPPNAHESSLCTWVFVTITIEVFPSIQIIFY